MTLTTRKIFIMRIALATVLFALLMFLNLFDFIVVAIPLGSEIGFVGWPALVYTVYREPPLVPNTSGVNYANLAVNIMVGAGVIAIAMSSFSRLSHLRIRFQIVDAMVILFASAVFATICYNELPRDLLVSLRDIARILVVTTLLWSGASRLFAPVNPHIEN